MSIKRKIIVTIGPSSNNPMVLEKLKDRGVDFFRINMSHTEEGDIESRIKDLIGYGVPVILDTEGSQVRTGNTEEIEFREGGDVKLYSREINCDSFNLNLRPLGVVSRLREGDLISLEFNSVLLRVVKEKLKENYLECKVVMGGKIGGKKAVQIDSPTFDLPPFSKKDHLAIELGKKYGIRHFTLSFMESPEHVIKFKRFYPRAVVYSKIESEKGLNNFIEISKVSEGILIDRGDLSSQVPLEKIPLIQKYVIDKVTSLGKEAFVATNTLENMAFSLKPSKAEVNDIINTLLDGASGIALTKETAVGKHPVETVNMLSNLINQVNFVESEAGLLESLEKKNYLYGEAPDLLVRSHGGKLVNRISRDEKVPDRKIKIDEETLMDIEQIAIGAFSPLEGFMESKDFHSVVNNYKLENGVVWPLPITLNVDKVEGLNIGDKVALVYKGESYATLDLAEIYRVNKKAEAVKIFGTSSLEHPGVRIFMNAGEYFLGGKIKLLKRRSTDHKVYELTPKQTRKLFSERGWSKVVGFHTRNVIHKGHEFIQLEAMKKGLCDGLFVHPIIGKKKVGDFNSEIIIKSYELMLDKFYPKSNIIFGTFANYSRYAGPREALFTALVRKNFGCSHFVVGRDHTGVGSYYGHLASQEIFDRFGKNELGIEIVKFGRVFYSDLEKRHIHELDFIDHPEENKMHISGTEAREKLLKGEILPEWYMRSEISKMIIECIQKGEKVFVN